MGLKAILGLKKSKPKLSMLPKPVFTTASTRSRADTKPNAAPVKPKRSYWENRVNSFYLQHISTLVRFIGRDAKSIIDVGSNGCPYLEWFEWIPRKVSIDLKQPYSSSTTEGIRADFLALEVGEKFDLCLCLQVLEHVPDVERFAHKLLSVSPHVIVSVPYRWPIGKNTSHIQDPVDEAKVESWFGRASDFKMISTEKSGTQRMICYFQGR